MIWPADTTDTVAALEAVVSQADHAVVPFAPVGRALSQARRARATASQAVLAGLQPGLMRSQEDYLAQAWPQMLAGLQRLEDEALVTLARPEGCATLWEIEFRAGLGHGARKAEGDEARRDRHFELALALFAERRPAVELYGPDVDAAFTAVADRVTAREAHAVALQLDPADATLTVDCRLQQTDAPVLLKPGRHAVLLEAPGFETRAEIVEVGADTPIAIALSPAASVAAPEQHLVATWPYVEFVPTRPSHRQAIGAIVRAAGARRWVGVGASDRGAVASLVVDGEVLRTASRRVAEAAVLAVLASKPPSPRANVGALDVSVPVAGDTTRKPLVRRWWFWVAIVAGAAATGVGLGVGLSRRDHAPTRLQVKVR